MQLTNEKVLNAKKEPEANGKVEEQNADEDAVLNKDKEAEEETSKEAHEGGKEEQEATEEEELRYVEPSSKNAEVPVKVEMTKKQVQRAPASGSKSLMAVCASMDANMLVKFICCNRTILGKEFPIVMRHAPPCPGSCTPSG
jgi:hypothetical protein